MAHKILPYRVETRISPNLILKLGGGGVVAQNGTCFTGVM